MTEALDLSTDEQLVALVCAGDKTAFRALAQRHGQRFRALAFRFTGDMALAEDLVQEAFVKLWTNAGLFDARKAKFTTWFYRIVVNKCLDEKRKRKIAALPEGFDAPDKAPLADVGMETAAAAARLKKVLDSLSERQKTAIILCYFDGLSNLEAAAVMTLNIKAFESLMVRARTQMRNMMKADKENLLSAFA